MTVLAGWALGSVSAGAVMVTSDDRQLRYAGVQNLAWGAVDGAIAGVALARAKPPEDPARERARLSRLFWINAALDIAYVTAGVVMMAASSDDAWKGTGASIAAQGGFLFAFDTSGALIITR